VVPTVGLVKQLYHDILTYSKNDEYLMSIIHCITSGKPKNNNTAKIFISTWQSIHKETPDYFSQFGR